MSHALNRPLVTVIVPVWNGERYLRESLDSILGQTYPAVEILVMDDASTDGTADIVHSYGAAVRYHRQTTTRGIYGNANDGIAMARGEYIAIYHADDVYTPTIVAREAAFLDEHQDVGAVFTSMIMMDASGREAARLVLPPAARGNPALAFDVVLNTLLEYKNCFLMCPSSMVRASVYRALGGYRDGEFRNTSDLDMWLRIARTHRIGVLEEPLFRYRFGHGSSAQRYHHLRTDPERYFRIVDLHLQQAGDAVATASARRAHEAHRAADALVRAVNAYILGRLDDSRRILSEAHASEILGSRRVQRARLLAMSLALHVLVCMPRLPAVAHAMAWRWHGAGRPRLDRRAKLANA